MTKSLIIFSGQQGTGKSKNGRELAEALGYNYFGTGDALRKWAKQNPNHEIAINLSHGKLAPSNFADRLFREGVISVDGDFVVDGYPRTTDQALTCHQLITGYNVTLILLQAPESILKQRLLSRERADDSPEAIEKRFKSWREVEMPAFNTLKNLLDIDPVVIDSSGEKSNTTKQLHEAMQLPSAA